MATRKKKSDVIMSADIAESLENKWPQIKRLVIYSRDEQKQFQMAQEYSEKSGFQPREGCGLGAFLGFGDEA